jgi:hypothetical protein
MKEFKSTYSDTILNLEKKEALTPNKLVKPHYRLKLILIKVFEFKIIYL